MSAIAPKAIYSLWNDVQTAIPQAVLSGIVGDVAHSFGYHLARQDLPADDYSVTLPKDRLGRGDVASALDVKLSPDLMIQVTGRLLTAAKARDPRLAALREFCGTTDGVQTHPYDLSNGQDGPLDSWDPSHLWHIHLSFYREFACDAAALAPIAAVMAGAPTPTPSPTVKEDEMYVFQMLPVGGKSPNPILVAGSVCIVLAHAGDVAPLKAAGAQVVTLSADSYAKIHAAATA